MTCRSVRAARRRAIAPSVPILVALLATVGQAATAQTARQGEEQIRHVFTFTDRATLRMGDTTVIHRELQGIELNDKGSGMFHDLGVRCLSQITIRSGAASADGRCTTVDKDGDQIFHTFENRAGAGAHVLVGGTGKYAGITGRQEFSGVQLVRSPEGVNLMVIPLRATWKLP